VRELLRIFAGYYSQRRDVDEVLDLVGLADKKNARIKTLSGGQRRRVDLAVALVGDPDLVFLDEPTTGFDPAARRAAWDMIRSLRSLGKTILLTTHYLDEAEQLADRLAVLREGVIIREGTPAELTGGSSETEVRYREDGHEVVLRTSEPTKLLHRLTAEALAEGRELEGLSVRRPTRGRHPESDPCPALATGCLSHSGALLDHVRVRASGGVALCARPAAEVDSLAEPSALARAGACPRSCGVRGARPGDHRVHPL